MENYFYCPSRLSILSFLRYRRYADGGAAIQPAQEPTQKPSKEPAEEPSKEPAKEPAPEPVKQEPAYTAAQLEEARQKAVEDYKKHLEEAKDFEKMTDAEKVVHLQQQMADKQLQEYTSTKLAEAEIPITLVDFAKGKDEKDTDARIAKLKAELDKGIQAGVEKRFKDNGYVPKGTAAGNTAPKDKERRQRGVSVQ